MAGLAQLKAHIKGKYPNLAAALRSLLKLRYLPNRWRSMEPIFQEIYQKDVWEGRQSLSGWGSDIEETAVISQAIPELVREMQVRVLLDAPCGDFHWMKNLELDLDKYIGVDIVPELIALNQQKYGSEKREFFKLDVTTDDLPRADLILCRDCLVHFSFKDIAAALKNFKKSRSPYLLTTTFTRTGKNEDIVTGDWRPLNLQLSPFNFPEPLKLINENIKYGNGIYADKSLGMWKLEDIKI